MTDDLFADIRPYYDGEVSAVLARLLRDDEFIAVMTNLRFGRWGKYLPWLLRPLVRKALSREFAGVDDTHAMQMVVKRYMDKMILDTSAGLAVVGLEQLPKDQPHLYMSNHRDIAMDPAFTNYALNHSHYDTVRIAIGDNLLTKPWVSDLMRLNKSFIVKRSLTAPRQLLAATRHLSNYIRHSLLEDRTPVWIAQREGRAKDGIDKTEPAVIKMLSLSRNKAEQSFGEHIAGLRIVPVAISYELDPCDELKARELCAVATDGHYEKGEQEDVASIGRGIAGNKGRVQVTFGTPLGAEFENADEVALEVDRQIVELYQLQATNIYAYQSLHGDDAPLPAEANIAQGGCSREAFEARIQAMPEAQRPFALAIYANAVVSKLRAESARAH